MNTLIGYNAGHQVTTGQGNTLIGHSVAGGATVTGTYNSAIGHSALNSVTSCLLYTSPSPRD